MNKNSIILVTGASGLMGSATVRALIAKGYTNIVGTYNTRSPEPKLLLPEGFEVVSFDSSTLRFTHNASRVTHEIALAKVDITSQDETNDLFQEIKPEYVFLAVARVGGIMWPTIPTGLTLSTTTCLYT